MNLDTNQVRRALGASVLFAIATGCSLWANAPWAAATTSLLSVLSGFLAAATVIGGAIEENGRFQAAVTKMYK